MATGWPMKVTYANGDVYSASDVNDTNGTINLLGSSVAYAAGKNKIINGDFKVWQRGTSFSSPASGTYTSDRWLSAFDGTAGTYTISQQAFTTGTAPVAGYESQFFARYAVTVAGTGGSVRAFDNRMEDVRTFAGQIVTVSFWAKADASRSVGVQLYQNFGSGGSGEVYTSGTSASVTTSWARYSTTISVPSISGKTIGSGNYLSLRVLIPYGATATIDLWGVQVEAGSTATAFQTATGTIQGELAACQRYYYRAGGDAAFQRYSTGLASTSTNSIQDVIFPVTMRVIPSAIDFSTLALFDGVTLFTATNAAINTQSRNIGTLNITVASGLTQFRPYELLANNSTSSFLGFTAEL